ncbi:hypothetical protein GQ42DRAFT_10729 [Ramicandelaber brevisporus]|nr:hypothetical protein GQ42DRAFT_10729 [Ramicandelaber brevisporus]
MPTIQSLRDLHGSTPGEYAAGCIVLQSYGYCMDFMSCILLISSCCCCCCCCFRHVFVPSQ